METKPQRELTFNYLRRKTLKTLTKFFSQITLVVGLSFLLVCFAQNIEAQQDSVVKEIKFIPEKISGMEIIYKPDTIWVKVEWLGWIQFLGEYAGIDPGFYGGNPPPTEYYRKDIEIGLREDGFVIWRKIWAKSN